jgi:hypothetical protein
LQRCYQRRKDPVSRAFRAIYKKKRERASLNEDIFGAWLSDPTVPRPIIGKLRDAFQFRHWPAHGRYWTPTKFQLQRFDFNSVLTLADTALNSFRFYDVAS